ncbi:MAG: hypothetical protein M1819_002382 [Sarea resinae]|nr:MAG: hypothetical protein M1819_002382 [Sarea resinae]
MPRQARQRGGKVASVSGPAHQLGILNETVNRFLGGKRKAWMEQQEPQTSGETDRERVSKRPRLSSSTAQSNSPPSNSSNSRIGTSQAATQDQALQTSDITPEGQRASATSLPPSNPDSPQLANVLAPSKSPAVEASTRSTAVLPSPAPSEEGARTAVLSSSSNREDGELSNLRLSETALDEALGSSSAHIIGDTRQRTGSGKRPNIENIASLQAPSHNAYPTLSEPPKMQSAQAFGRVLTYQIAEIGLQRTIEQQSIESPRFSLLQDACASEDWFYLALHQVYCIQSGAPEANRTLPWFGPDSLKGLQILEALLLPNNLLRPSVLDVFRSFPVPLQGFDAVLSHYKHCIQSVVQFLELLGQKWETLQAACRQRAYPPFANEIVAKLGLHSHIFQRVVFTAIHRNLWGASANGWCPRVEELFRKSQAVRAMRLARTTNSEASLSSEEVYQENRRAAQEYQRIHEQYRRSLSLQSQNVASSLQSPASSQQQSHFAQPGPPLSQPSRLGWHPVQARAPQLPVAESQQVTSSCPGPSRFSTPRAPNQYTPQRSIQVYVPPNAIQYVNSRGVVTPEMFQAPQSGHLVQVVPMGHQNGAAGRNLNQLHPLPSTLLPSNGSLQPNQNSVNNGNSRQRTQLNPGVWAPRIGSQSTAGQKGLLFPPNSKQVRAVPHPNSTISALHQARLRSPILSPVDKPNGSKISSKLYQFMKGFMLVPKVIGPNSVACEWRFAIPADDFALKAEDAYSSCGGRPTRNIQEGSRIFRIRCVKTFSAENPSAENRWAVSENTWPEHVYLTINDTMLETRRKLQHGKDLPVDVTPYVKEGDRNILRVSILWTEKEKLSVYYAFAVESIEIIGHESIKDLCLTKGLILPQRTLEGIKAHLNPKNDDDEICVVDNNITIELIDPFTARIFDVPVRSQSCIHRECFDLETFLQTRKSQKQSQPCLVDEWKCPICGADARPPSLVIDGFLVEVRSLLAQQNLLETRAILVSQDGSWKPKSEKSGEDRSASKPRDGKSLAACHRSSAERAVSSERVIIEIDD